MCHKPEEINDLMSDSQRSVSYIQQTMSHSDSIVTDSNLWNERINYYLHNKPLKATDYFLFRNFQNAFSAHPVFCSMKTEVLSWG